VHFSAQTVYIKSEAESLIYAWKIFWLTILSNQIGFYPDKFFILCKDRLKAGTSGYN